MDTIVIFALAGCLFSAAVMYVVMDYRQHGEREEALEKVLRAQAEMSKTKKALLGYTKYLDYLDAGKQLATDKMKSLTAKVVREHVHIETIQKEEKKLKTDATVIVKYSVEYSFGFDLKPENFNILGTTSGIEINIGRPALVGAPFVKTQSHEIPSGSVLIDQKAAIRDIQDKLPALAQQHGLSMESEASIRALCEKKLIELIGDFLSGQAEVTQVPLISVVYK